MRIELTWPRPGANDRTVAFPVPSVLPVSALVRHTRRACSPAVLGRALGYAEPLLGSAAGAAGVGAIAQLALPAMLRMARQSLDSAQSPRSDAGAAAGDRSPL